MSDEERSSFYQELAANFIDMAADEVEGTRTSILMSTPTKST